MKKALCLLGIVFLIILSTLGYAQRGILYNFEKIPGSEFYTYITIPVEGMIEFSETVFPPFGEYMLEVFMKNNSRKAIDFNRARCEAVKKDGKTYYLEFEDVEVNTGIRDSLILKPEDIIIIYGRSPIRNDNLNEIYIRLNNGNRIHFVPYKRLGEYVDSPEQYLKNLLSGLMEIFKFKVR